MSTSPARQWLGLTGIIFGAFMAVLDVQIVNTCLNDIAASLNTLPDKASWLMTSYLTAEVVAIPLISILVHRLGLRDAVLTVMFFFAVFSLACANAWNFPSMVFFRALQGLAGGTLIPLALTSIMMLLPRDKQTVGMSIFAVAITCAPTLGPALGGWLSEGWGWRWIFFINLPPALLMMLAVFNGIPVTRTRPEKNHEIDVTGLLFLLPALAALEIFLEEGNNHDWFETSWVGVCGIIAVTGMVSFCLTEYRSHQPLINLKLLQNHRVRLCCWAVFGLGMALYGSIFLITRYHAQVHDFSPLQIAKVLLWMGLPQLLVLPFVPRLLTAVNAELCVIFGFLLFLYGTWLNIPLTTDFAGEHFYINQVIRAIGQPFIFVPLSVLITRHLDVEDAPSASILVDVFLAIGGATGIAMLSTLLDRRFDLHYHNMREVSGSNVPLHGYEAIIRAPDIVSQQAAISAYSDGFFLILCFILLCLTCVTASWVISSGSLSTARNRPE